MLVLLEFAKFQKQFLVFLLRYLKYIFLIILLLILFFLGCPFNKFLRVPCPACGITHSWIYLLNGKICEAFKSNCFFLPLTAVFLRMIYLDIKNKSFRKTEYIIFLIIVFFSFVYNICRIVEKL